MSRTNVMVNGIPGNMAANVARHILADDRFALVPFSLTGPEIRESEHKIETNAVRLLKPDDREQSLGRVMMGRRSGRANDDACPMPTDA